MPDVQCTRTGTLHFLIFELLPFVNFHTCPGHFSLNIKDIDMKLHRMINLINKKCSVQELVLCISYFLSYCPLFIFIFHFALAISPKLYCSQGDISDSRFDIFSISVTRWSNLYNLAVILLTVPFVWRLSILSIIWKRAEN
jgi:hypothetical protein